MKSDPFLLRAIEHWLDSANELTYQPLFCFWLTTQNFQVKYAIKNTQFEEGKDVVAVAPDGKVHAYQLKGKDINLNRWRTEVLPEIVALRDTPVKHPEVKLNLNHISYLVVNGNIEDSARIEINDYNSSKWKDNPLHIITRGDLLKHFQELSFGILPDTVEDYKKLIDFIFEDGFGLPDLDNVSAFLYQILKLKRRHVNKSQCQRDIASAILYANMIVGNYRKVHNYASVVQVMTMLAGSILHMAEAFKLEDKYWKASFVIVWNDILDNAKALEKEVIQDGFEKNSNSPFDADLFSFRKHAALSIIWPLKLSEQILNDVNWSNIFDNNIIDRYKGTCHIWSEASLMHAIFYASLLRLWPEKSNEAKLHIHWSISMLLELNGRNTKQSPGLPTPYYSLTLVLNKRLGFDSKPYEDNFKYRTSYLGLLIDFLVRLGDQEFLQKNWREISFMRLEEFIPDNISDYLLWRAKEGVNKTTIFPNQKKWSELVSEANSHKGDSIPSVLRRFPEFVPFFISVFPHRLNRAIMGLLLNSMDSSLKQRAPK